MASTIAQKIGKKYLASHAAALEPRNPQYEITIDPKTGREIRKKRDVPPGLSKKEEKILRKIRKRAHRLDKGFSLCGFRFGWTALIGLIPVVGDVVDTSLSYFLIIRPARKCDIPVLLLERMLLNQAVSTSIGLVPLVGDIIVAVWKVNSRNAALFEDFLVARGKANLDQTTVTTAAVSTDETARLISDSTKPGYIDGKTGERSDQSTSGAGLTSQAGPSTQLSAASAPIIESTVSDSDLKPADKRRSRWWFSRKTEGKDS